MFYVISYENGATRYLDCTNYNDVLDYAESHSGGHEYTVEEYDSQEDWENNL